MYKKFPIITLSCILIFSLCGSGCANKAQSGAGLGALVGATAGALASKNKAQGALLGAGAGAVLGYIIGNEMDKYDQQEVNTTLETVPSGQTHTWSNPDTGYEYEATPHPAYTHEERIYRDVEIKTVIDGEEQTVLAKAYRDENGEWRLVQ